MAIPDEAAVACMREVEELDRFDPRQQHREIGAAGGDFGVVLGLAALDIGLAQVTRGVQQAVVQLYRALGGG